MIETVKNADGYVVGYIEWQLLNHNGQFDVKGDYIYIQDVWINERHRKENVLKDLVVLVNDHPFGKTARYVYWEVFLGKNGGKIIDPNKMDGAHHKTIKPYKREYILNKILRKGQKNVKKAI